ncbi:M23 family metallopeptidase [Sungkyunkwania multivorans]|uniref:M23 family metallopeptidase n=1 Tax=Sungkyunkwania multivorans TaxID=1173618 RepID=A0ABW3CVP8_9FLAO
MFKKFIYTALMLTCGLSFSQKKYPANTFMSPVEIPIVVSGTFGELRSNHFHSGIDIRTEGREGLNILAIGDGYVSRIKIAHGGFGKALYVTHPNGYTSVYAHLQKFAPKIEAYIKKRQYAKESYQIQAYPDPNELSLKKGEIIALSGNTGGSAGPHLHFEIRDTATEHIINPLWFGLEVPDSREPTVKEVFAYAITDSSQVNRSNDIVKLNINRNKDGIYVSNKIYANGTIGFGLNTFDRQDGAWNKNGIYKIQMFVNGAPRLIYDFETFSFAESRYINTLIDYEHYKTFRQRVQRLYKVPANRLSIYERNNGYVTIAEGLSYDVEIAIEDFAGNMTEIKIPIEGKRLPIKEPKMIEKTDKYLVANRDNNYEFEKTSVYFAKNTFYDDFYIDLREENDTLILHNDKVPAHKNFTISFDASAYEDAELDKMFIAMLESDGSASFVSAKRNSPVFKARSKSLGTYFLAKDTIAPTIQPMNFAEGKWLSNAKNLKVKIDDDFSGIKSYRGTINGEWVLFEYEYKTNTLTYDFDDKKLDGTKHNLKLTVTDNVGNSTTFASTFYRKDPSP